LAPVGHTPSTAFDRFVFDFHLSAARLHARHWLVSSNTLQ